jgi:hypothetical protein
LTTAYRTAWRLLLALVVARTAFADEAPSLTTDVTYEAPPQCPDAREFQRGIDARVGKAPRDAAARELRRLSVRIELRDDGFTGFLRAQDVDGSETSRQVSVSTCNELVEALAFLAALAMGVAADPMLAATATPEAPPAVTPPPVAKASASHSPPFHPWRFEAGGEAAMTGLVGPGVRFLPEPFIEVRHDVTSNGARTGWLSAVRLSFDRVGSSTLGPAMGGTATLTLTAGRLDACPLRVPFPGRLSIAPCVGVRVGILEGTGNNIIHASQQAKGWLSVDAMARFEWEALDWLVFEGQGGPIAPLFRYEYYFGPNKTLYNVPAIGGFAGLGAGVRFP